MLKHSSRKLHHIKVVKLKTFFCKIGETKCTKTPWKTRARFRGLEFEGYRLADGLDFYVEVVELAFSLVVIAEIERLCRGSGVSKIRTADRRGCGLAELKRLEVRGGGWGLGIFPDAS